MSRRATIGWGITCLLTGYDDSLEEFNSMDSFKGPNTRYSYDDIERYWQHFNYKYIVLYTVNREEELMDSARR